MSNVSTMEGMFKGAKAFNMENISKWDVSRVKNMNSMFYSAKSFNQDISAWNTNEVTSMYSMFDSATLFQQNLCPWITTNPLFPNKINTLWMFYGSGCPNTISPTDVYTCFTCIKTKKKAFMLSPPKPVPTKTMSKKTGPKLAPTKKNRAKTCAYKKKQKHDNSLICNL